MWKFQFYMWETTSKKCTIIFPIGTILLSSCVVDDVIIALTTFILLIDSPSRETQKAIHLRLGDPFYSWHILS